MRASRRRRRIPRSGLANETGRNGRSRRGQARRRSGKKEKQYKLRNSIRRNQSAPSRYISMWGPSYTGANGRRYRPKGGREGAGGKDGEMGKVAAWRPVRRGKNDRALTRYKSHYGVNLLDPSPPTDFQPPGTVLGCRLWATSHANSDKVPLSLCLPPSYRLPRRCVILVAFGLSSLRLSLFFSIALFLSSIHSYTHIPPPLFRSLSLSLWFYSAGYPHSRHPRGTPTPTDQSQGISVPGTSAC